MVASIKFVKDVHADHPLGIGECLPVLPDARTFHGDRLRH